MFVLSTCDEVLEDVAKRNELKSERYNGLWAFGATWSGAALKLLPVDRLIVCAFLVS